MKPRRRRSSAPGVTIRRAGCVLGLVSLLLGFASRAEAVSTQVWVQETYADFNEGEGAGVRVVSKGYLQPGMLLEKSGLKGVSFVFSMVETPQGVVMGTGDGGEVWLDSGRGPKKVAALKGAVVVTALVSWKGSTVLAGTLPEGKIFSVDLSSGKAKLFSKVGAKHIWCMVKKPRRDEVFVGTGPDGKVFRVSSGGKSSLYWDSPEKHILSMSYGPSSGSGRGGGLGGPYVGSAPKAIVYKLLGRGKARAIHDFDATEVRALSGNSKVLYAAVNKMKPATIGYPKVKPSKGKGTAIKKRKVPGSKACRKIPRKGAKKGKGGVFRLWETGAVQQLHGLGKSYFTALEVTPEGDVYAGEGKRGQVFWLGKDGSLATVADVKERQVMALSLTGKVPALGTGDSGVLYKRKKGGTRRYVSEVLNAKIASRWGRLEWRGSRGVKVEVRSGNTAEADKSWSAWVPLRRVSRTLAGAAGQVKAPAGQYLQYRVVWPARAGAAVKVEGLNLYFVPMNRQAKVVEIRVHDQKSENKKSGVSKAGWLSKITTDAPDKMKIQWKVKNPDGDPLWYRVAYRGEGEKEWIRIGGDEPLTATKVSWAVGNLPDGRYYISVTATDARSNPSSAARAHTMVGGPYLVDNTNPKFKSLKASYPRVQGVVTDAASRVTGIQYSLDGKTWHPVGPRDGVFDTSTEGFSFRLPKDLEKKRYILLIRAFDEAGNSVVQKRPITVK